MTPNVFKKTYIDRRSRIRGPIAGNFYMTLWTNGTFLYYYIFKISLSHISLNHMELSFWRSKKVTYQPYSPSWFRYQWKQNVTWIFWNNKMCSSSLNFLDCTLDMFLLYYEKSINKDTQLSLKCTKIFFQNRNSVTTVSGFWFYVFCRDFTGHMLKTVIEKNRASTQVSLTVLISPFKLLWWYWAGYINICASLLPSVNWKWLYQWMLHNWAFISFYCGWKTQSQFGNSFRNWRPYGLHINILSPGFQG